MGNYEKCQKQFTWPLEAIHFTSFYNETTFPNNNNNNNKTAVTCRVSLEGISARERLQTASILTEFDENPDL